MMRRFKKLLIPIAIVAAAVTSGAAAAGVGNSSMVLGPARGANGPRPFEPSSTALSSYSGDLVASAPPFLNVDPHLLQCWNDAVDDTEFNDEATIDEAGADVVNSDAIAASTDVDGGDDTEFNDQATIDEVDADPVALAVVANPRNANEAADAIQHHVADPNEVDADADGWDDSFSDEVFVDAEELPGNYTDAAIADAASLFDEAEASALTVIPPRVPGGNNNSRANDTGPLLQPVAVPVDASPSSSDAAVPQPAAGSRIIPRLQIPESKDEQSPLPTVIETEHPGSAVLSASPLLTARDSAAHTENSQREQSNEIAASTIAIATAAAVAATAAAVSVSSGARKKAEDDEEVISGVAEQSAREAAQSANATSTSSIIPEAPPASRLPQDKKPPKLMSFPCRFTTFGPAYEVVCGATADAPKTLKVITGSEFDRPGGMPASALVELTFEPLEMNDDEKAQLNSTKGLREISPTGHETRLRQQGNVYEALLPKKSTYKRQGSADDRELLMSTIMGMVLWVRTHGSEKISIKFPNPNPELVRDCEAAVVAIAEALSNNGLNCEVDPEVTQRVKSDNHKYSEAIAVASRFLAKMKIRETADQPAASATTTATATSAAPTQSVKTLSESEFFKVVKKRDLDNQKSQRQQSWQSRSSSSESSSDFRRSQESGRSEQQSSSSSQRMSQERSGELSQSPESDANSNSRSLSPRRSG